ncbi:hypothetical protein V1477_018210 [Vespula maculifrons]|uniref:Uncharacterized protein n=1 Tax=Vespula maculifrons TaxID=7453 RepID=A0ABD2AYT5_VESMC
MAVIWDDILIIHRLCLPIGTKGFSRTLRYNLSFGVSEDETISRYPFTKYIFNVVFISSCLESSLSTVDSLDSYCLSIERPSTRIQNKIEFFIAQNHHVA